MVEIELAERVYGFKVNANGIIGSPILIPRGALKIRPVSLKGSLSVNTNPATAWTVAIALLMRTLDSTIASVQLLGDHKVLSSRMISNADLGAPSASGQVNTFPLDDDYNGEWDLSQKAGSTGLGYTLVRESDVEAIEVVGLLTFKYEIHWPDSRRTRDLGRIRRMGLMN